MFSGTYWFEGGTGIVCRIVVHSYTSVDNIYKCEPSDLVHYSWDPIFLTYGKHTQYKIKYCKAVFKNLYVKYKERIHNCHMNIISMPVLHYANTPM